MILNTVTSRVYHSHVTSFTTSLIDVP